MPLCVSLATRSLLTPVQLLFNIHPAVEGIRARSLAPSITLLSKVRRPDPDGHHWHDSAFFRNSVWSQHAAEGFYCEPRRHGVRSCTCC